MKKFYITYALALFISGCSWTKEVTQHCQPEFVSGSIQTGSFKVCLKCDSLAQITYKAINEKISKK